jgi:hypothetical protein
MSEVVYGKRTHPDSAEWRGRNKPFGLVFRQATFSQRMGRGLTSPEAGGSKLDDLKIGASFKFRR